jgi:hypothetical protein
MKTSLLVFLAGVSAVQI